MTPMTPEEIRRIIESMNGTDASPNETSISSGQISWHGPTSLADMVKDAVDAALRDPARIAAALVLLPQEIRDQVRVLLDALEAGSPRPSETPNEEPQAQG